jgi:predicted AAA+ superfamily ATPase
MLHNDNNYMLGISGKRGAGKDTFAQLIHYCDLKRTYPKVWADKTFDEFQNGDHTWKSDWESRFFAQKLKKIAAFLTGHEDQYTQAGKTTFLPEWGMTVGEIQQKLGTDAIRNGLHDQAWILACFADIREDENTLITDMRFPNEMGAVKNRGGITVRIDGDPKKQQGDGTRDDNHPSETSLDNADFDVRIINDGTLAELEEKALILLDMIPHYSRDIYPETIVI